MSFIYGHNPEGLGDPYKVYGRNLREARYNALLETFYLYYPGLQRKVKPGKNYFERDPQTARILEERVLGGNVYLPDEDEEILTALNEAYYTTRYRRTRSIIPALDIQNM
jgi:hypothetical protein